MPIHDWKRVEAGTYHDFHQGWTVELRNALNRGVLPEGYFAMADQRVSGPEPDVVALQLRQPDGPPSSFAGAALLDAPPRVTRKANIVRSVYARKANRIVIRHRLGRVVAMIELVSPGNKDSVHALRTFAAKAVDFLRNGIHLLIVDLFPPTPRDPQGLPQVIWTELTDEPLDPLPPDKPLTAAAYDAGDELTIHLEPLAVGDRLPQMPLFLEPGKYVLAPLEASYAAAWEALPQVIRNLVQ